MDLEPNNAAAVRGMAGTTHRPDAFSDLAQQVATDLDAYLDPRDVANQGKGTVILSPRMERAGESLSASMGRAGESVSVGIGQTYKRRRGPNFAAIGTGTALVIAGLIGGLLLHASFPSINVSLPSLNLAALSPNFSAPSANTAKNQVGTPQPRPAASSQPVASQSQSEATVPAVAPQEPDSVQPPPPRIDSVQPSRTDNVPPPSPPAVAGEPSGASPAKRPTPASLAFQALQSTDAQARYVDSNCEKPGGCDAGAVLRAEQLAQTAYDKAQHAGVSADALEEVRRGMDQLRNDNVDPPQIVVGNYAMLVHTATNLARPGGAKAPQPAAAGAQH